MTMEEMDEIRERAANHVRTACREYGLYGNVIYYAPSPIVGEGESNRNRLYIIAGTSPRMGEDPLPIGLDPDYLVRRTARNKKLFYPGCWAFDFSEVNQVDAMH